MRLTLMGATLAVVLTAGLFAEEKHTVGPILSFTATADNVGGAHQNIRIDLLRWSTFGERDELSSAWTQPGIIGKRERNSSGFDPDDPTLVGLNPFANAADAAGRGGRGGRAEVPRVTPDVSLAAAVAKMSPLGYLWSSSEVAGYALHYASRRLESDGGEHIVLITDRRLGAWNDLWKAAAAPTDYKFSVIELHVNSKGEGEGKISLAGKIAVDSTTKGITLENYGALPVMLKNVKRITGPKS